MPDLTQRSFDSLLAWLDPDRDRAGEEYEIIRYKLVKFFERRDCPCPEDLADQVFNRVSAKIEAGTVIRTPDHFRYFYGVAVRVLHEYRQLLQALPLTSDHRLTAAPRTVAVSEHRARCLDECLARLPRSSRCIIEQYYRGDGGDKIRNRKELAQRLGISQQALRAQCLRIRERLERCVRACMEAREPT